MQRVAPGCGNVIHCWKSGLPGIIATALLICLAVTAAPAQAAKKFRVVTTFTVIQDIAQNVAGDAASVVSITKPGAEIHEYQPTP
ncbi:MAG TPA: zinc ABC transporter substrate-binding protein, partial [Hyphomicrobiaceae bacterium]|nr:zinc ABC transporter substrate-binding protein [Hyphomicrobiaceae bacterium]